MERRFDEAVGEVRVEAQKAAADVRARLTERVEGELRRMEGVAAKAGVELAEASVRSFLRRCVITDVD